MSQSLMLKKMNEMMESFSDSMSTEILGEMQQTNTKLWQKLGHHEDTLVAMSERIDSKTQVIENQLAEHHKLITELQTSQKVDSRSTAQSSSGDSQRSRGPIGAPVGAQIDHPTNSKKKYIGT